MRSSTRPTPNFEHGFAQETVRSDKRRGSILLFTLWLMTLLVSLASAAEAQTYVFNNASFATGFRPSWVMTGDFNKDGIMDLATVNQCGSDPACLSNGTVSILLGNPDGTFQSPVDYGTGSLPRFGMVGDFNADGIPDIAVANLGSTTISILLGKGDGTFQSQSVYGVGNGPLSIVAGDFNGDGKVDLAVANSGASSISVLLGNGDGTFQAHAGVATSFAPQSVAAADFNGDGKLDLVVADMNVSVLLGKGDGTFQPPAEYPGNGTSFVAVGDFNGDGKMDVAATESFSSSIAILLGKADGTLQTPPASYEVGGGPESILVTDLNGDGHLDLAVAAGVGGGGTNQSGTLSILINKGDGTFQPHRDFGGMTAVAAAVADFNGDGHVDLAVPNRDFNVVNVMLGDGQGTFGSFVDIETLFTPPSQVLAGDFNGDGKSDLAFAAQGSGSVAVALSNGDGTFKAPVYNNASGGGLSVAIGDFNGDGKLDLAGFLGSVLQNLQVLPGNGDGTFSARLTSSVANNPGQVVPGDLNGDGKQDLVVAGFGCDVLVGNGDGTFTSGSTFACGQANSALVADFNGDGKADLAVVDSSANDVTIFLGLGNGTFQSGVSYATGITATSPLGMIAADLNGDGHLDLAVANAATNTVSVFLGNGDGTLQTPVQYAVVQGANSVAAGDFAGDGKIDLAATGNGISFLMGNGDGTFQTRVDYLTSISVRSAVGADFNGDGRADLAVANTFASSVSAILSEPAVALHPSQLSFPSQLVGQSGTSQAIMVYNPGIVPLTFQSAAASGDFSESDGCAGTVKPGANCVLSVNFKPTAGGTRTGTLTIRDNAVGNPQTLQLTGIGADFSLGPATGANCSAGANCSLSAAVSAGEAATFDLQVTPIGGFNGTVAVSCNGGPAIADCTATPVMVNVNGTNAVAFTVTATAPVSSMISPVAVHWRWPRLWTPVLGLALFLATMIFALRVRWPLRALTANRLGLVTAVLLVAILAIGASGCGSSGGHGPHTFTLHLTGMSGGVSHTVQLTVRVN